MSDLLQISHLGKSYDGKNFALKDVSASFKAGEFVVVIGPSGAGKSTFIRCINHMIVPSEGEIVMEGIHLEKLKGRALREQQAHIGMVFQNYNLIGRTSVIKNVLFGRLGQMSAFDSIFGRYSQKDIKRAMELLQEVGLGDQMDKRADALSGGQQQRVGICRAVIQNPKLLLADEPIASLDPQSAKIVMDTLANLTQQYGLTCIVNLHQVDFAKKYATRIIGIKGGHLVYDGKPEALSDALIADIYKGKEDQMTLKSAQEVAYA